MDLENYDFDDMSFLNGMTEEEIQAALDAFGPVESNDTMNDAVNVDTMNDATMLVASQSMRLIIEPIQRMLMRSCTLASEWFSASVNQSVPKNEIEALRERVRILEDAFDQRRRHLAEMKEKRKYIKKRDRI